MQLLFILCLLSLTRRSEQVLVSLSNAARLNQIYVVINIEELMNCTVVLEGGNCPNNTDFRFNTNVVFVRNGAVIDRIPALTPDLDYFETDFGVRLSHFICFNLMFQVPAVQTVLKLNVTDVIFSTMWFSEMPYLTAVQIQEDYAYAQNVNFLAAGANNVRVGSAGLHISQIQFDGIASGEVRACAVYACVDDPIECCAIRFDTYIDNSAQSFFIRVLLRHPP